MRNSTSRWIAKSGCVSIQGDRTPLEFFLGGVSTLASQSAIVRQLLAPIFGSPLPEKTPPN
jgi:hypothetical protein